MVPPHVSNDTGTEFVAMVPRHVPDNGTIWEPKGQMYALNFKAGCLSGVVDLESKTNVLAVPMQWMSPWTTQDLCARDDVATNVTMNTNTSFRATMQSPLVTMIIVADVANEYTVEFAITATRRDDSTTHKQSASGAKIQLRTPIDDSNYRFAEDDKYLPSLGKANCSVSITKASNWFMELRCAREDHCSSRMDHCYAAGSGGSEVSDLNVIFPGNNTLTSDCGSMTIYGTFYRLI